MEGIRPFYEATVKSILEKFPLHDEAFMHAKFVDFTRREAAEFRDVEYFVERYGAFLSFTPQQLDVLHDEFVEYQLLEDSDIPLEVWKEAKENVEDNEGADEEKQPFIHMDKI